ncbi:MAG: phytanoyl-CoA dioxygenase family protein [Bacteroidetes bacterium]|nr:phytanoyl-CoA dioxygenase family protein [Bacteroidota bacterium]
MSVISFFVDGIKRNFSVGDAQSFVVGKDEVLSQRDTDVVYDQSWYNNGYTESDFLSPDEYDALKEGLTESVKRIVQKETSIKTEGFSLENYHHYVTTDEDHLKIVSRTRDLFSDDFNFPVLTLLPRLENILNFKLSDIDPKTKEKMHIIVRINRPQSKDFNPPHKDVYHGVDIDNYIPLFVNFWIPVCGATNKSNLPVVPKSHLLSENKVLRTIGGSEVEGNKYRVCVIKSWDGKNELTRSKVKYGQVLIFSSHLIHGLALNDETDKTRVALEFRLFKA